VTRYHDLLELLKGHVHRDGPYRLASGKLSPCYLDVRGALLTRRGAILAAAAVLAELRREGIPCRALGGPGLGGALLASSCLATARADRMPDLAGFVVRPEKKGHGLRNRIEGDVGGKVCVVVDDVATSGGSLLGACEAVAGAGGLVAACVVVTDRLEGARQLLAGAGRPAFFPLMTAADLGVHDAVGDPVEPG
jgi:orotate phosphoribosyltransferase